MSLPAYPSYRDSGHLWLQDVPAHWEVVAGRRLFRQVRDPSVTGDQQLSASQKYGIIPQSLLMAREDQKVVLALNGVEGFKHVNVEDFVISLRSFQGGIEHSAYAGCVSPAYTVLRPTYEQVPGYYRYLLKAAPYISALQTVTDGIRDGKNISYEQFGKVGLPLPPLSEQTAVVAFLDHETAKIDALLEEQRRLIELLKQKRQAEISHAVTKGLDPTVPMKDSGVGWLGQVPVHWALTRLKHRAEVKGRIGFRGYTTDDLVAPEEGAIALGGANLGDGKLRLDDLTYLSWRKYHESPEIMVEVGDIIMGQRGTCGKVSLVDVNIGSATINPSLVVLKEVALNASFVRFALMADSAQRYLESFLSKTAIPMLTQEQIGNTPICEPPLDEQQRIAHYLVEETTRIDALIAETTSAADLLIERRAALISAAVTGKVDVRGVTAQQAEAA